MTIVNELHKAKAENKLISISTDVSDWASFSVGYVHIIQDDILVLRSLDKYGRPSGYELRFISEIVKIDFGGRYEKKITLLESNSDRLFAEVDYKQDGNKNVIFGMLQFALNEKLIVVLWGEDEGDSLVGYVDSLNRDIVKILNIDDYGEENGKSVFEVESITSIDLNTKREQVLKFMHSISSGIT